MVSGAPVSRTERRRQVLEDIRERIQARMYLGLLRPGDRVMTAREQARRLGVDPRMVLAAYGELEREGLVVRRERSGVYLAETAHVPGGPEEQLADWAVDVLYQGLARGLRVREVPRWLERAVASIRLRAVCIECNDDQLHAICHELGEDYGLETVPVELDRAGHPDAREREALHGADLVITTSTHAREVNRIAAAYGKPFTAVEINPEWGRNVAELLASGPVYIVAADARFARKMRAMFRRAHSGNHLSFVIIGRDDPGAIPPEAPVWVTRLAAERFEPPASVRVMPQVRVLAPDSARELLRQLVGANTDAPAGGA